MSKFKVGDRVRILHTDYVGVGLEVGSIHHVESLDGSLIDIVAPGPCNEGQSLCFSREELELLPTNTLTVGQTYTSRNGNKWECIFTRGDSAWLVGVFGDGISGSAYEFAIDGCAAWCHSTLEYDIVFEPVRETVTIPFLPSVDHKGEWWSAHSLSEVDHVACGGYSCNVTLDTIDGTPDWSTAKVTPCA